jgi:exonuclease SbcD
LVYYAGAILKLFHTSDWHLGRSLYSKKRYSEFQKFLDWLVATIRSAAPDILIIAGDVFDTTTPSNKAQEMYYQFLCQVATTTNCQHVVVIGGNHDSPTLLNAPGAILKQLQIHVVGSISDNPQDEVLTLRDKEHYPLAIICAVPYLRDRDLRTIQENETALDKDLRLMAGIKQHYAEVCELAKQQREQLKVAIPIIAVGHLFVAGGKTETDDGVRELYVGSLARYGGNDFPECIDYLALGHLHVPQLINGHEHLRYSGSPIAMGFGEARQQKIILSVEFQAGNKPKITSLLVPKFQELARISGNLEQLTAALEMLVAKNQSVWVEAIYTGQEMVANLNQHLQQKVTASPVELIKVVNRHLSYHLNAKDAQGSQLELSDLTPLQVFEHCLNANEIPQSQQDELKECYQLILSELAHADVRAE